ncbi:MAG: DUF3791 domain-containing protein [Bacteroidales bacterium]|nr:DUF3791 domain-containing protein [Bacteroidales bacterium]
MGVYENNIIPIKIARLAEYVSERKRISLDESLVYIYSNDMYPELYDEGAKWWYLSNEALYEEFEKTRRHQVVEATPESFEFFVYTLEKYALQKGIGGLQALALFKEYGADMFLLKHYDMLHTQGTEYVIDEIQRFINRRKRK